MTIPIAIAIPIPIPIELFSLPRDSTGCLVWDTPITNPGMKLKNSLLFGSNESEGKEEEEFRPADDGNGRHEKRGVSR